MQWPIEYWTQCLRNFWKSMTEREREGGEGRGGEEVKEGIRHKLEKEKRM